MEKSELYYNPVLLIRRFLLVTPPDYHNHVLSWISKNSKFLRIEDITPKYACIGIFGPEGIGLLQNLTLTPLDGFSIGENKVLSHDRFGIDFDLPIQLVCCYIHLCLLPAYLSRCLLSCPTFCNMNLCFLR